MLTQVIAHAEAVAQGVLSIPGVPGGEPQAVLGHVRNFESEVVPELKQTQVRVSAFAASLTSCLAEILPKIENGAAPGDFAGRLQAASEDVRSLVPHVKRADEVVGRFRTTFSEDVGELTQLKIRLDARTKSVAEEQKRLRKEAGKLRARIDTINKLSALNPFIKLGSELANLITRHKTTEASLAEASRDLLRANLKQAGILTALAHVEPMQHLIDQLAAGTQGIKNTLSLIEDKLGNEDAFLSAAKKDAELFLTALEMSAGQLEKLVS